jgi:hypothetical protein
MQQIQFIQISPEQLQEAIIEGVKTQLDELKNYLPSKEPKRYLTRKKTAELLNIDLSTLHNWNKQGILKPYQLGGRVFYRLEDIENALIKLK